MTFEVDISRKQFFAFFISLVVFASINLVISYNLPPTIQANPSVFGHSPDEIGVPNCNPGQALTYNSTRGWSCISAGSGECPTGQFLSGFTPLGVKICKTPASKSVQNIIVTCTGGCQCYAQCPIGYTAVVGSGSSCIYYQFARGRNEMYSIPYGTNSWPSGKPCNNK